MTHLIVLTYHRFMHDWQKRNANMARLSGDTRRFNELYKKQHHTGRIIEWLNQRPA